MGVCAGMGDDVQLRKVFRYFGKEVIFFLQRRKCSEGCLSCEGG